MIADNMCKLVPDVTEIQPFLPTQGHPRVENEGRKNQVPLQTLMLFGTWTCWGSPRKATGDDELRLIPLVEKSTQTISDPEAIDDCSQHAIPTAPANSCARRR